MNKKLILSMALLTGITQNCYALSYKTLIFIGGAVATGFRTAWHVKSSQYNTPEQKALDAFLGLGQDLGKVTKKAGVILNEGGEWLEEQAKETRSDLSGTFSHESFISTSDSTEENKLENTPKDSPVADFKE